MNTFLVLFLRLSEISSSLDNLAHSLLSRVMVSVVDLISNSDEGNDKTESAAD